MSYFATDTARDAAPAVAAIAARELAWDASRIRREVDASAAHSAEAPADPPSSPLPDDVVSALGDYNTLGRLGLAGTHAGMILAHTALSVPVALLAVTAALKRGMVSLE